MLRAFRAEQDHMKCIECGADASVKRDDAYYCGSCAIARDWRDLIAVIQDARVETPVAGMPETKSA